QGKEEGDVTKGFVKGSYLKSGNYFINFKNYIEGLENGLTNAYNKDKSTEKTNSITIAKETKNGVNNIAKSKGKNAQVIGSKSGEFGDNAIAL
ncbi:hypothetical protein, partial [Streptobacillus moniliformis]|uniref:hypothetical protein n=1 Tax=Streptobacillus moniliformis TaxID=34105 RepID=UPI000B005768